MLLPLLAGGGGGGAAAAVGLLLAQMYTTGGKYNIGLMLKLDSTRVFYLRPGWYLAWSVEGAAIRAATIA